MDASTDGVAIGEPADATPAAAPRRVERHGEGSAECADCGWLIRVGAEVCTRCGGKARTRVELSVTEKMYLAVMRAQRERPLGLDDPAWWERILFNHYIGRHAGEVTPQGFTIATPLAAMQQQLTHDAAAWARALKEGTCRI